MKYLLVSTFFLAFIFSCSEEGSEKSNTSDSTAINTPLNVSEVMGIAVIEPENRITELSVKVPGVLSQLYVSIGDSVKKGDLILKIESEIEAVQLSQNRAQILTQKQSVSASKANLDVIKSQLDQAIRDLNRAQKLFEGKAITLEKLEKNQFDVALLKKQMTAQNSVISQQEAAVNELETNIQLTQTNKAQKEVCAPADGVILSMDVRQGEYISPGSTVAEFAAIGPVMALTEIDELFASKIKVGQSAQIRKQGSEEVISEGIVVLTSPYLRKKSLFSDNSSNLEDRRVREVRVQLANPSEVLLGARVECWIETE